MSDNFNRNLVILIFVASYMYMNFVSLQIRTRSGWSNLTCNPLNLFANSLFQSQEKANEEFERCVVSLSTATTRNLFQKQTEEQERVLTKMTGIQQDYTNLTDHVKGYVKDASMITQEYDKQIDTLEISQEKANILSKTANKSVKGYMSYLREILNNISNYFQNN